MVTSPVTHFVSLATGFLCIIQLIHTHAHYTMSVDTNSYVRAFCKKNFETCQRILNDLED